MVNVSAMVTEAYNKSENTGSSTPEKLIPEAPYPRLPGVNYVGGRVHQELDGDVRGGEGYGAERAVGGCPQERPRERSERDRDELPIPWIDRPNHS